LLGYASNVHGYRVFNNTTGLVEIAVDVTFDECNGSQGHVSSDIAGNENSPCEAIKKLAIGEVRPQGKDSDEGRIPMINGVIDRVQRWLVMSLPPKQTHQPQVIQSLKKSFNHKRCQL
jgi:hypothetical protein